jgi:hypothetical protein
MPIWLREMNEIAGNGKGTINALPRRSTQETGGCAAAVALAEENG